MCAYLPTPKLPPRDPPLFNVRSGALQYAQTPASHLRMPCGPRWGEGSKAESANTIHVRHKRTTREEEKKRCLEERRERLSERDSA